MFHRSLKAHAPLGLVVAALALSTACETVQVPPRTPTRPETGSVSQPQILTTDDDGDDSAEDYSACRDLREPVESLHRQLYSLLNVYRRTNGLHALEYSGTLEAAADAYARRMYEEDFFAHEAPDGTMPWDRAVAAGYCDRNVGENLAWGLNLIDSPNEALTGFKNSPEHNENMLRERWDFVGIGYYSVEVDDGVEYFWVQLFGDDLSTDGS